MPLRLRSYDFGTRIWRWSSIVWNSETAQPVRWATAADLQALAFGRDLTVEEQQRVDDGPMAPETEGFSAMAVQHWIGRPMKQVGCWNTSPTRN